MKKYVILALLAASTSYANSAKTSAVQLPSTLHCVSVGSEKVSEISFSNLVIGSNDFEYEVPADSALEGSDNDLYVGEMTTIIHVSNGCDNNYDLMFHNADLSALARGKKTTIPGMQSFFFMTEADDGEEHALVNCTL